MRAQGVDAGAKVGEHKRALVCGKKPVSCEMNSSSKRDRERGFETQESTTCIYRDIDGTASWLYLTATWYQVVTINSRVESKIQLTDLQ